MLRKLSWALVACVAVGAISWTADRPTAAHALSNCAVDDLTVDDEEQAFLRLINDYRARNKAPALAISPALTRAATWMAYDLSTRSGGVSPRRAGFSGVVNHARRAPRGEGSGGVRAGWDLDARPPPAQVWAPDSSGSAPGGRWGGVHRGATRARPRPGGEQ